MLRIIFELGVGWMRKGHDESMSQLHLLNSRIPQQGNVMCKLQYFDAEVLCHREHPSYELLESVSTHDMSLDLMLHKIQSHTPNRGVGVTAFSREDASVLIERERIRFFKIASPDAIDRGILQTYLNDVMSRPIMISTGGMSEDEIFNLCLWITRHKSHRSNQHITLMHCCSEYPIKRFSLLPALFLRDMCEKFDFEFGYSHHSPEMWPLDIMSDLGATVFEVHIVNNHTDIDRESGFLVDDCQKVIDRITNNHNDRPFVWRHDSTIHTRRYWMTTQPVKKGDTLDYGRNIVLCRAPIIDSPDNSYSSKYSPGDMRSLVAGDDLPADHVLCTYDTRPRPE